MKRIFVCILIALLTVCLNHALAQDQAAKKNRVSDPRLSRSYLYLAGIYRINLKLSERQMDSIRVYSRKALKMAKKMTTDEVNLYERSVLRRIMAEGQYEDFFVYKNIPAAKMLAEKIWNEMLSLKYVTEADSARLYTQVRGWLHTVLVARDYYSENPELQVKYLEELSLKSPACLYRYYHNGERKPPANNYYRSDFVW